MILLKFSKRCDDFEIDIIFNKLLFLHSESINSRLQKSILKNYEGLAADALNIKVPKNFGDYLNKTSSEELMCTTKWSEDEDLECSNKFIFTKEGRFIVTAILLDPIATACDLRVSFMVKVNCKLKICHDYSLFETCLSNFNKGISKLFKKKFYYFCTFFFGKFDSTINYSYSTNFGSGFERCVGWRI